MENVEVDTTPASDGPIRVERWPTEIPLFILVVAAAAAIWLMVIFSIFGIVYALFIMVFLLIAHLLFIAYVRGSSVRLGPNQFPELYSRVVELSNRAGLRRAPEAYVMQQGGSLNALATRFFRSEMIVLYSDLLEACGDNDAARDMVIGHEIGHHKAGHLKFHWLFAPGMFVPFLGAAYSRAREFTCDRYGMALTSDRSGGLRGLAILAAGGELGPKVDLAQFVRQRTSLDTGWMTLAKWLSGYPPLADRVAALHPALAEGAPLTAKGPIRALAILATIFLLPVALGIGAAAFVGPQIREWFETVAALEGYDYDDSYYEEEDGFEVEDPTLAAERANSEIEILSTLVREYHDRNGFLPDDFDPITKAWELQYPETEYPSDPFDGLPYGFEETEDGFAIWSSGPDQESATDDDIRTEVSLGGEER